MKPILLAFSGGIDSCAAVGLLRDMGYHVEALTIDMMGSDEMVEQARVSAERLGVTLHVIDGRKSFERDIIDNFTTEYNRGRTPAPCTRCNTLIKWKLLAMAADDLGIYHIATGHYFQITELNGRRYVTRGVDPHKDQSYYLWGVPQEILKRAVTPLGEMIKSHIKAESHVKHESMGVCFLRGKHYTEFLCERCGNMVHGDVVTIEGEVVGEHNGVARYTVGQRRGEGIPSGLRVLRIEANANRVIVGENELLHHRILIIDECYFVNIEEVVSSNRLKIMVRGIGRNPSGFATISLIDHHSASCISARIELEEPAWAAAAGQPVAIYIDERVVGGGYLRESY